MDADAELKLQKASSELIRDFETSLRRFLSKKQVASVSKTNALAKLLEPFQEWPQLLDPHLRRLVPPLVSAFLGYLLDYAEQYKDIGSLHSGDKIPISRGISRILYTFCKIRGYKVISNFLNNEPKHFEPMLYAYGLWNQPRALRPGQPSQESVMTWEERYIMLLWISHLSLTPFDLAALSSDKSVDPGDMPLDLPMAMPSIAKEVTYIAIRNLSAPSKEREAAGFLLARLALRPDMRPYKLLNSTIDWALSCLAEGSDTNGKSSIYDDLGALSFLTRAVNSADSKTITPFLLVIFKTVQTKISQGSAKGKAMYASALARKLLIKLLRAITGHTLYSGPETPSKTVLNREDALEEVIDHLLTSLADKDTPVRYAASKALSIIAAKLDPALAADIVEALIGSLEEDISWQDLATGQKFANHDIRLSKLGLLRGDLTAVNALRWHGLVLALSQLLYHRSPPPDQLPNILNALILALSFEQRSAVGASIGTNVRDAACFGIWALARRYSTKELLAVDVSLIRAASDYKESASILQVLADEIVVAACLDPAGNIRRGASAALQELIGRHPDTIEQGISVVQIVDYHAVALRSRALVEVASGASDLSPLYWDALFNGLLDTRCIGSADAPSRCDAATAIGLLSHKDREQSIRRVRDCLRSTTSRQVEERHGLLLSLAAIVARLGKDSTTAKMPSIPSLNTMSIIFEDIQLADKDFTTATLRPQLTAEAACGLISAFGSAARLSPLAKLVGPIFNASLDRSKEILRLSLGRTEDVVINATTAAAKDILYFSDNAAKEKLIQSWISAVNNRKQRNKPYGTLAALGTALQDFETPDNTSEMMLDCMLSQLAPHEEIETRVWTVRSLQTSLENDEYATNASLIEALSHCLDDYTTDQRGDIGSLLRHEATNTIDLLLSHHTSLPQPSCELLLSKICRLSVEKLDKVRNRAWSCLQNHYDLFFPCQPPEKDLLNTSSSDYFAQILTFTLTHPYLLAPILTGLLTSTTSGSDSILRASRLALSTHIDALSDPQLHALLSCLLAFLRDNQHNERLSLPVVAILAFLGEINVFEQLAATGETSFDWSKLLALVSKFHYKSTNVRKLVSCISCYSSFAHIPSIQQAALIKLCDLLMHPYPTVRRPSWEADNIQPKRKKKADNCGRSRSVAPQPMRYTFVSLPAQF